MKLLILLALIIVLIVECSKQRKEEKQSLIKEYDNFSKSIGSEMPDMKREMYESIGIHVNPKLIK